MSTNSAFGMGSIKNANALPPEPPRYVRPFPVFRTIEGLCLIAMTIFACWALSAAHRLVTDSIDTVHWINGVLPNIDKASQQVADTALTVNAVASAETAKVAASIDELHKTERATRAAIDSLRQIFIDVHQTSLPRLNTALDDLDKGELHVADDFAQMVDHAKPALDALTADVADPAIKESIAHLDASSADLDANLQQLHSMLVSGAATAADIQRVADKVAYEYTKTRNLAYALFKELLSVGSQGVQFFLRK